MTTAVSGAGRLVVGASGSPGSLCALRYALALAYRLDVPLVAALAWVPPGGDLADRRFPSPELRRSGQMARESGSRTQWMPHTATARELGLGSGAWAARRRDLTLDRATRDWAPPHSRWRLPRQPNVSWST